MQWRSPSRRRSRAPSRGCRSLARSGIPSAPQGRRKEAAKSAGRGRGFSLDHPHRNVAEKEVFTLPGGPTWIALPYQLTSRVVVKDPVIRRVGLADPLAERIDL